MAWIKRNLYFVITVVVGLGLTGYCGYLFSSAVSENGAAKDAFIDASNNLTSLQNKRPYPSKENIEAAQEDADRIMAFRGEFLKTFSGFPPPPKVDDRQFNEYLKKTISRFGAEATNAGVNMNPGYAFGFAQQAGILTPPAECIAPWMQELEEINAILHILYSAKINFLEHIKRPLVSPNDTSEDSIQLTTTTNQNGVSTPYRLEFRAFSSEIANVLAGFANASNCFIVRAPIVEKSTVPLPDLPQAPPPTMAPPPVYRPQRPFPGEGFEGGGRPGGRGEGGERGNRMRMAPPPQQVQPTAAPSAPTAPVTILREKPLFVTLYIEVVKLKALETNSTASGPKSRSAVR